MDEHIEKATLRISGKEQFLADCAEAKAAAQELKGALATAADEAERLNNALKAIKLSSRQ